MIVTYYLKLFRTEDDTYNGILMSLILLVTEAIKEKLITRDSLKLPEDPAEVSVLSVILHII